MSGTLPFDRRFTGQVSDAADSRSGGTKLLYYNQRYFDAMIGTFVAADRIVPDSTHPLDLNRYGYVRNNPVNATDPTGGRTCADYLRCVGPGVPTHATPGSPPPTYSYQPWVERLGLNRSASDLLADHPGLVASVVTGAACLTVDKTACFRLWIAAGSVTAIEIAHDGDWTVEAVAEGLLVGGVMVLLAGLASGMPGWVASGATLDDVIATWGQVMVHLQLTFINVFVTLVGEGVLDD